MGDRFERDPGLRHVERITQRAELSPKDYSWSQLVSRSDLPAYRQVAKVMGIKLKVRGGMETIAYFSMDSAGTPYRSNREVPDGMVEILVSSGMNPRFPIVELSSDPEILSPLNDYWVAVGKQLKAKQAEQA